MGATKKGSGVPVTLLLFALAAAPLLLAPPIVRGLAADAWVKHYAALPGLPHPGRATARALVEKADLAIWNLAPLPQASTAAILTLEIGQEAERDRDQESALLIYRGVQASCARVRDRAFSGSGFAVIEARAKALEDSAAASRAR